MTLDSCCISKKLGEVFLAMECVVSAYFIFQLWRRWLVSIKYEEYKVNKKNKRHHMRARHFVFKKFIPKTFLIVLLWIVIMSSIKFSDWMSWIITIIFLFTLCYWLSHSLMHGFMYKVRYNNQFIIKQAFYIIVFCIFASLFFYGLESIDISEQVGVWSSINDNLHHNIFTITNIGGWIRIVFVFFCVCNVFFVPLFMAYGYNYAISKNASKSLDKGKKVVFEKLKLNNDDYFKIVEDIKKKANFGSTKPLKGEP